jgi:hypothetical protein
MSKVVLMRTLTGIVKGALPMEEAKRARGMYYAVLDKAGREAAREQNVTGAALSALESFRVGNEPVYIGSLFYDPKLVREMRLLVIDNDYQWAEAARCVFDRESTNLYKLLTWPDTDEPDATVTFTQETGGIVDMAKEDRIPWKENGWKWSSREQFWHLPKAGGNDPFRVADRMMRGIRAAVAAGQSVRVDFDPGDMEDRLRGASAAFRRAAERAHDRAVVHRGAESSAAKKMESAFAGIEPGQPIIRGHEAQYERAQATSRRALDAAEEHRIAGESAVGRMERAEAQAARMERKADALTPDEERLLAKDRQAALDRMLRSAMTKTGRTSREGYWFFDKREKLATLSASVLVHKGELSAMADVLKPNASFYNSKPLRRVSAKAEPGETDTEFISRFVRLATEAADDGREQAQVETGSPAWVTALKLELEATRKGKRGLDVRRGLDAVISVELPGYHRVSRRCTVYIDDNVKIVCTETKRDSFRYTGVSTTYLEFAGTPESMAQQILAAVRPLLVVPDAAES